MSLSIIITAVIAAFIGIAGGYYLRQYLSTRQEDSIDEKIARKLSSAKEKIRALHQKTEKELDTRREQIIELEKRIAGRENKLEDKLEDVDRKQQSISQKKKHLTSKEKELDALFEEEEGHLAEISGLTNEQAQARVLERAEERTKEDIVRKVRKLHKEGERQFEDEAQTILSNIIQRYAASHVAENSTSYVSVPDESMIGRVIGKEGRNIQHLERLTGCEIVIDETPNSIMISGFSPMRRQIAKKAIETLLQDGRIHPGRIEEVIEESKQKINDDIREASETVLYDLGIVDFPEQLVHLIGRMKYRTSYKQNILRHSWEATHIAMMLAEELGADVNIVKRATLLHDIGKAIDHEVEGNHVEIGEKIMRKFNIPEEIIQAAIAHHDNPPFETREALIVQVADAISAARPGARQDNMDEYIKRMEDLENIATNKEGVKKAYAIYAGREIRVFVEANKVDDLQAMTLSQEIAKEIEQDLTYPGEVRVNVIRETRSNAIAK